MDRCGSSIGRAPDTGSAAARWLILAPEPGTPSGSCRAWALLAAPTTPTDGIAVFSTARNQLPVMCGPGLAALTMRLLVTHAGARGSAGLRLDEVLPLLERLRAGAETAGRMRRLIEVLAFSALALHRHGNTVGACEARDRALTLAAPEGYIRVFVDNDASVATLVAQSAERKPILDSCSATRAHPPAHPPAG